MGIEGAIINTTVRDVFRLLIRNASNGKLIVWNATQWGLVWITKGNAVSAVVLHKADKRPLHTGEQAIFTLMTWTEGDYSFSPDTQSETYPVTIKRPTGTLIVESVQRDHNNETIAVTDQLLKAPLKLLPQIVGANSRVHLSIDEWYLLTHIGQETTSAQLVEETGMPTAQVLHIVSRLIDYGMLMRMPLPQKTTEEPRHNLMLNNLMRALRRRLNQMELSA